MTDVTGDADNWVRVDDADAYGRGGLLPMAVFLTQNAPGLRTSPVKRGYWVVRRVLGETIPPPPPTCPELPTDEAKLDLPLREMLAQHRENPAAPPATRGSILRPGVRRLWAGGRERAKDLAGQAGGHASASFPAAARGRVRGLQAYIRQHREKDFLDNLCRKLLVYALGRSLHAVGRAAVEDAEQTGREWLSVQYADRDDRDQPAVPEQTKPGHVPRTERTAIGCPIEREISDSHLPPHVLAARA